MIKHQTIAVTTTGSAGSATGSSNALIRGEVLQIFFNFHASAPATTDTTVELTDTGMDILVVTSSATDVTLHPRAGLVTAANAAITDGHHPFVSDGLVTVSLAQCDALTDAVVATIWYRE